MKSGHDIRAAAAEAIELLAVLDRLPTSDGERRAAGLIRDRFAARGCKARVEDVPAYHSYAQPIGILCASAAVAGLLAGPGPGQRWRRPVAALIGAAAAYGIVDDITGARMLARRALMRRRSTTNVIAETGEPDAPNTLVVLVHHDAAPSGIVFGQYLERWLVARHPEIVESMTSNPPLWWVVIAGPALVSLASAFRLVGRDFLRWLGMMQFARAHFGELDPEQTWFLTLDTVGSGHLVMLEGEGPVRMRDYDVAFKRQVAECAEQCGISLMRGLRSRNSTDGSVPRRHGFATATLVSLDDRKLLPNYHLYSDTPTNVDYRSVEDAVRLTEAVARRLAARDEPQRRPGSASPR